MMIRQLMSNLNVMAYVSGSQTQYNVVVPTYGMPGDRLRYHRPDRVRLSLHPALLYKGLTLGSVKG